MDRGGQGATIAAGNVPSKGWFHILLQIQARNAVQRINKRKMAKFHTNYYDMFFHNNITSYHIYAKLIPYKIFDRAYVFQQNKAY